MFEDRLAVPFWTADLLRQICGLGALAATWRSGMADDLVGEWADTDAELTAAVADDLVFRVTECVRGGWPVAGALGWAEVLTCGWTAEDADNIEGLLAHVEGLAWLAVARERCGRRVAGLVPWAYAAGLGTDEARIGLTTAR